MNEAVTDRTALAILREMKRHHDVYAEFYAFTKDQYTKTRVDPGRILRWLGLAMLLWLVVFGYWVDGAHYRLGCM